METEKESQATSRKLLALNVCLLLAVFVLLFCIYDLLSRPPKVVAQAIPVTVSHAFDNLSLEAKSVYVLDVDSNTVIYQKNDMEQLPLASLTKLMTALVSSQILQPNSPITIQPEFLEEDGDNGLLPGETWTYQNLLNFTLIVSSNDGARAIASAAGAYEASTTDYDLGLKDFITKMNTEAQTLGLKQTYYINEDGLDVSTTEAGAYGSAMDMGNLMKYIVVHNPALLEATVEKSATFQSNDATHTAINTDLDIGEIPGLIASKTGYTDLAGGNLAVTFDTSIGRPIIIVVLGSTEDGRFTDVAQLVKASLEYVNQN